MNQVSLIGRITKDLELRKTPSNKSVVAFTLAVDRRVSQEQRDAGAVTADFISCVVWNQSADYLAKWAGKGTMIALSGHLATRNYDTQHGKVYVTEVVANEVKILTWKEKEVVQEEAKPQPQRSGYTFKEATREVTDFQTNLGGDTDVLGYRTVAPIEDDELPFY